MKGLIVRNVEVGSRMDGNRISLACEWEGARYHVWMRVPGETVEDTVYKNPIKEGAGEKTRKLRASSKQMQALIAAMLDVYHRYNLLGRFEKHEATQEVERLNRAHSEYALDVKREFGPELYDVVKALVEKTNSGFVRSVLEPVRVVLEKIDNKVKG